MTSPPLSSDPSSSESGAGSAPASGGSARVPVAPLVAQAVTQLDMGDAERAELVLGLHLARYPDDPAALAADCMIKRALGQGEAAEISGRQAVALAPDDPFCATALGLCLLERDGLEEGETLLRAVLSRRPAWEQAIEALISLLTSTGRQSEITELLVAAMVADPDSRVFPTRLCAHQRVMGDREAATETARRAVERHGDQAWSWRELGICLLSTKPTESLQALDRARSLGDDSADCWNLLGIVLGRLDRMDEARAAFERAIALNPSLPQPWTNLGNLETRADQGKVRLDEGIAAYRGALALDPNSYETLNNLSLALRDRGDLDEALVHARAGVRLRPDHCVLLNTLASILRQTRAYEEALQVLTHVLTLEPDVPENLANMGLLLMVMGRRDDAEGYFRSAGTKPGASVDVRLNLVTFLTGSNQHAEAEEVIGDILEGDPSNIRALMSLGLLTHQQARYADAESAYDRILAIQPGHWEARFSRAVTYWSQGRMVEALDESKALAEERPGDPRLLNMIGVVANDVLEVSYANQSFRKAVDGPSGMAGGDYLSNLCFNSHYGDSLTKDALFAHHREWDRRYGAGILQPGLTHRNERNPDRPLRIGYVSPDFRRHSVAYFILPVIANHDRRAFEVTCYSQVRVPDSMTALIRENADHWRDISSLTPDEMVRVVRDDRIDILVDLAGHTAMNALPLFARKPAPVQVTYLGYPNTTGLTAMDWRLTDVNADPEGRDEDPLSEKAYRLPRTFLLFRPADDMPDVVPPPVLEKGHVTFGSFNNLAKISRDCLKTWGQILEAVPGSRLLLKAKALREAETKKRVSAVLRDWGLDMDRVDLVTYAKTLNDHMALYGQVDIALDTFPYNGTTTTFEALHMGVPLVGCRGTRHSGRVGASILTNLGLAEELLGEGPEDMARKAVALARDLPRLTELRAGLRERLARAPSRNTLAFMADLEAAYRDMWSQWVAGPPTHEWTAGTFTGLDLEAEDAIVPIG